jgi:hypothetical protein
MSNSHALQIYDERTYFVTTPRKMEVICCDCGLTHKINFRVKGKEIIVRVSRNDRSTAQQRRYKNGNLFEPKSKWKLSKRKKK